MSKNTFSLHCQDVSQMARTLAREWAACQDMPSHVQILNMLARSSGFRNFQHLRAQQMAQTRLETPPTPPETVDHQRVLRVSRHFDATGTLMRWPKKSSERLLCLWVLWAAIPAGQGLRETEINDLLSARHGFGDYALLRRFLCDLGMMDRTRDGRQYRRREAPPPPDAVALIRHVGRRAAS